MLPVNPVPTVNMRSTQLSLWDAQFVISIFIMDTFFGRSSHMVYICFVSFLKSTLHINPLCDWSQWAGDMDRWIKGRERERSDSDTEMTRSIKTQFQLIPSGKREWFHRCRPLIFFPPHLFLTVFCTSFAFV